MFGRDALDHTLQHLGIVGVLEHVVVVVQVDFVLREREFLHQAFERQAHGRTGLLHFGQNGILFVHEVGAEELPADLGFAVEPRCGKFGRTVLCPFLAEKVKFQFRRDHGVEAMSGQPVDGVLQHRARIERPCLALFIITCGR